MAFRPLGLRPKGLWPHGLKVVGAFGPLGHKAFGLMGRMAARPSWAKGPRRMALGLPWAFGPRGRRPRGPGRPKGLWPFGPRPEGLWPSCRAGQWPCRCRASPCTATGPLGPVAVQEALPPARQRASLPCSRWAEVRQGLRPYRSSGPRALRAGQQAGPTWALGPEAR